VFVGVHRATTREVFTCFAQANVALNNGHNVVLDFDGININVSSGSNLLWVILSLPFYSLTASLGIITPRE